MVCQNDYRGTCGETYNIRVKKCPANEILQKSYYVYELVVPTACDAAYCAEFRCGQYEIYNYINDTCVCK